MPAGEDATRAALAGSVDQNRQQVAMTDESRVLLVSMIRSEMPAAVADGIRAAMTEDNARLFVQAALAEMQRAATMKAGEVAGGFVKALLGKALLFLVLGSLVYAWGGWGAIAALVKWLAARES